jgi:acyl-homoserine lactone acylase PvdQ
MRRFAALVVAAVLLAPAAARAATYDVLPPGANGLDNAAQLGQFEATGQRPPNSDDQLGMYANLLYGYPGLSAATLPSYFKDSAFGAGGTATTEHPRPDVTIVHDRFGVPHIYGATRDATEFGVGYATAEDRLFFIDVLRHVGRAELSSFVGGSPSNRILDAQVWAVAPYTEQDLQRQVDYRPAGYEAQSDRLRADASSYIAGINRYIAEARLNPLKMPAEYAAINRPGGPADFTPTDIVATSTLVGAIFGAGGGQEIQSALTLQAAKARFGRRGKAVWSDFRAANDPEAPTTVRGRSFPYEVAPRRPRGVALPDPGSVRDLVTLNPSSTTGQTPSTGSQGGGSTFPVPGLPTLPQLPALAFSRAHSNALVISSRDSATGRPLAVFGPQVAYFSPEILMEEDVHGPGIDARGAAFPGTNLYVQLGHGRGYAWSATSAGQDLTDTFAVPLCEPNGAAPTLDSQHYLYRGQCLPIEVLQRTNSWRPSLADQTPAGSQTLTSLRTALGIVVGRATIKGQPYIYTSLRTTYLHETDSALAFSELNDPAQVTGPAGFMRAAYLIAYTFNWFYVDAHHTAYFNSGENPVRAPSTDPSFPVQSSYEWRGYDPSTHVTTYAPASTHPQTVDQDWMTSWNNKQARGVRASDGEWGYGPLYRSQLLDERVRADLKRGKITLPELVQAMEDAATVDLRGDLVLPWALRVLAAKRPARVCSLSRMRCHRPRYRRPAILNDPAVKSAIATLAAWHAAGSHRRETRPGSRVYQYADAIRIMDAWWPQWIAGEFEPTLGKPLFDQIQEMIQLDNPPNNEGQHLGSAYQDGWWGYAQKDLRTLLGLPVHGRYSRTYCGGGSLARCQAALASSLKAASSASNSIYSDPACKQEHMDQSQWCYDTIQFRPLGAITMPPIAWQNRPTYQQAVSP